jgi:lactate 2-monooxygenase
MDSRHGTKSSLVPDPAQYEAEAYAKGITYQRTRYTYDCKQWEALARDRLPVEAFNYVHCSAGTRETDDKNREAFRKWSIVPRRLVDQHERMPDMSVTVLGHKLPFPIALAPVGVQTIFHPYGETASARAAGKERVPYIFSSASSTSPEKVAEANGAESVRFYQLYWPSNEFNDVTASLLRRAKAAGYTALFVTLDTYLLGWYEQARSENAWMCADGLQETG